MIRTRPSPRRARRWSLSPLLALLVPWPAHAVEKSEEVKIQVTLSDGSLEDIDVIGRSTCEELTRRRLQFTVNDERAGADEEKYLRIFANRDAEPCEAAKVEQACERGEGESVDGCICIRKNLDLTAEDQLKSQTLALSAFLENGGADACTNSEERRYRFWGMIYNPDGLTTGEEDTATAGNGADAGKDAGSAEGVTAIFSATPIEIEVDLARPNPPSPDNVSLSQDDAAVKVDFPDEPPADTERYKICWRSASLIGGSSDVTVSLSREGGEITNEYVIQAQTGEPCLTTKGVGDATIDAEDNGLVLDQEYTFSVASIDNADNLGESVDIGTEAAKNFLDLAEYYRLMHGTETGGCRIGTGRAAQGAGLSLLVAGGLLALRRRRKPPCA